MRDINWGGEGFAAYDGEMFIGTALAIGLGVAAAASSVGSAAIGAHAAGSAADAGVNAANQAANLQHQDAQAALDFNKQTFQTQQNNLAPWLTTGRAANANLASLLGVLPQGATIPGTGTAGTPDRTIFSSGSGMMDKNLARQDEFGVRGGDNSVSQFNPFSPNARFIPHGGQYGFDDGTNGGVGQFHEPTVIPGTPGTPETSMQSLVNPALGAPGSLAQGWQGGAFQAPTDVTEQNDPGFQFRLAQGQKAIEQSAAARGGLLSGGTAKALGDYSQNSASNEYSNVYNRALNEYQQNYNQFQQGAADKYNRLANLAGMGQITAQQLGQFGTQAAGNNTNILLTSGQQIGQDLNNAGAARASGYVGAGNAWGGALSNIGNTATQLGLLGLLGGNHGTYVPMTAGAA